MKLEFSQQNLEKYSDIKFDQIPSNGSRSFYAGRRTDRQTDRQTVLTKLSFAKVPKMSQSINFSIRNAVFPFVILLLKSVMKQFITAKRNKLLCLVVCHGNSFVAVRIQTFSFPTRPHVSVCLHYVVLVVPELLLYMLFNSNPSGFLCKDYGSAVHVIGINHRPDVQLPHILSLLFDVCLASRKSLAISGVACH